MINPFEEIEMRLKSIEKMLLDIKKDSDKQKPLESIKMHSIIELAKFLKVSTTTAQRYKNEGCPCAQYGRKIIFDTLEVVEWFKKRESLKKDFAE